MGIKGLGKLINKYSPYSIKNNNKLKNSVFSIDIYIMLYSIMITGRKYNNGYDQTTSIGRVSGHIKGMYHKILNFINNNVDTLWVFDGPPPDIKKNLMIKRSYSKNKAKSKLINMISNSEEIKYKKKTVELSKNIISEVQTLLNLFGLPYIEALTEGEMQCAAFSTTHNVVSDDWDTLVFGSSCMIKNVDFIRGTCTKISLPILLADLGLTHEQFVEVCILMGCDYCPKIKGIYFDVYQEYIKHKNVLNFIEDLRNDTRGHYDIPDNYMELFNAAKDFYLHGEIIDPHSKELNLKWRMPDFNGIINYLCNEFEFDKTKITQDLHQVKQKYELYLKKN